MIEDIAAARFTLAMQPRWIVRKKDKDYGIDLEAELLTDDDTSSGHLFYVQSKATDEEGAAKSVQMKVDRLNYLTSFEAPSMIVRYSEPSQSNYWMWAIEALTLAQPRAKTVTLKFDERHRWTENTPAEVERTLPILRILKRSDHRVAFPFRPPSAATATEIITTQRVIDQLAKDLLFLRTGNGEIPIELSIEGAMVTMSIERIVSLSAVAESEIIDDLATATGYLLADLLRSLNQVSQARKTAKWCLDRGRSAPTEELAAKAAIALLDEPDAAVNLALLNDLHKEQGFGHTLFRIVLISPFVKTEGLELATNRFYQAAIEAHEARGEPIGEIRYSYANYLVSVNQMLAALRQFNQARRDVPDYWNRAYFLRELGGLLFRRSRYGASARAYHCAVDIEPTEKSWFCLGDAELYDGNFPTAIEAFHHAISSDDELGAEARLKSALASWAIQNSIDDIGNWDSVHPIREEATSRGEFGTAFWAHLALAFYFEDDIACWADAIFLALLQKNLSLLEDILILSGHRTQLEGYAKFKDDRAEFLSRDPSVTEELDRFVVNYNQRVSNQQIAQTPG